MQTTKPTIKSKNGYVIRLGRGYSAKELKQVDLNTYVARKNSVPIDPWRKTQYQENIDNLKLFAQDIMNLRMNRKGQRSKPRMTTKGNRQKPTKNRDETRIGEKKDNAEDVKK